MPGTTAPYVVEVKFGYSVDTLLRHLKRKYSEPNPALAGVAKVVLVIDSEGRPDWSRVESEAAGCLCLGWNWRFGRRPIDPTSARSVRDRVPAMHSPAIILIEVRVGQSTGHRGIGFWRRVTGSVPV